jgi:RNA polymerase sigma-70 factor (ECF subfamily)
VQRTFLERAWDDSAATDLPMDEAAARAPEQIFELVYRQMRALSAGRHRRDFEDLVQIALEHTLRALPSFHGKSRLSTWTYSICYLTLLKHDRWYRRWLRRFAFMHDELPERAAETATPAEALERAELGRRLLAALAELSPKRRAAVVLHDLEGFEIAEIAQITGDNPLTIRSRLRDGRKLLKRALSTDPEREAQPRKAAP